MQLLAKTVTGIALAFGAFVAAVYALSSYRIKQTIPFADTAPTIPRDSVSLERGRYLVRAIAKCADCHGSDLGGGLFIDGGPLGRFYGPNLTSGTGSVTAALTDADIVHAVRHGLGPGGRKLAWMPSEIWPTMADEDVAAIVAYIRSVPAVNRVLPPQEVGPLGRLLYVVGRLPLFEAEHMSHEAPARIKPPVGPTAEYGGYLALIGGCRGCHGPTLSGGQVPGTPPEFKPAANITPTGIGHYTEADFFRAMRDGLRPDGSKIDPFMPVSATKLMTDDDTRAVWLHLQTVPGKPYGGR